MRIITKTRLSEFWNQHPKSQPSLRSWFKQTKLEKWQNFNDLRATFPSADAVKRFVVFNIGGNKYRLIARVNFRNQKVYIRAVLTHAEYDKEKWKDDPWFN